MIILAVTKWMVIVIVTLGWTSRYMEDLKEKSIFSTSSVSIAIVGCAFGFVYLSKYYRGIDSFI